MILRFHILVPDSGISKTVIAIMIVLLVSAVAVLTYAVTQLSLPKASPTPTSSATPTASPTPMPTATPTPTSSNSQTPAPTPSLSELTTQEKVRDSVMGFIKSSHPETSQFMTELIWTGGRVTPLDLVGAETYMYYAKGWNFTINYPVVPNAIYNVTADYSAVSIGIPHRIIWKGTWQIEAIKETSYVFAQ